MDRRVPLTRLALKLGPALLVLVSSATLFLCVILPGISVNELEFEGPKPNQFEEDVIIGDRLDSNLMWFLQVTDLHLSTREHPERQTDFIEFSQTYIDIFKPDAVLVTGDITDARVPNTILGTGQQLEEWQAYWNAISKTGAIDKTKWLDIRGNHDNFNVYRPQNADVLYRKFSVMGKKHARNYYEIVEKGTGDDARRYTFIGVDEVQTPGLKIFNFLGVVKAEDLEQLKDFKAISREKKSDYNIWFAHYPTSSIASPDDGLRKIIDGPYLCGHYHTIRNWVSRMHATQQPGYVELELGDWKYNRRLRLAAVDHQLFSFVDVGFRQFPVALMTNPKGSDSAMPKYEPLDRAEKSTHIRVLAFSNATSITKVEVSIDDGPKGQLKQSTGPLWVLEWNPSVYKEGLHEAKIHVEDSSGQTQTYRQTFSFDFSKEEHSLGARILLRAHFRTNMMVIFYLVVIICTLPLLILRSMETLSRCYQRTFLYNLQLLSSIRALFIPLMIIPLWIAIGPLFIGYLVDESLGVCFAWGVITDGTFLHTGITFNAGLMFLIFVHIPQIVLLSSQVASSYESLIQNNTQICVPKLRVIVYLAVTTQQLYMGILIYSAQGALAFLTSFPHFWCIFVYLYCWYQCTRLDKLDFGSRLSWLETERKMHLGLTSNMMMRTPTGSFASGALPRTGPASAAPHCLSIRRLGEPGDCVVMQV